MQAMVHAPLLRNFYLSGSHVRSQCLHSLAKPCLSCELVSTRSSLQLPRMLTRLAECKQAVEECMLIWSPRLLCLTMMQMITELLAAAAHC